MSGAMFKLVPEEILVDLVPGSEGEVVVAGHAEINEKVKAKRRAKKAAKQAAKKN